MPFKKTPGVPFERDKCKIHECELWREGRVRTAVMARIIGIQRQHLRDLCREGKVPSVIYENQRWYTVDEVMEWGFKTELPFPVFKTRITDHLADALWAWDAICMKPWKCKRAPSGRAWRLYLDGKKDLLIRRSLVRAHMVLANRKLAKIGDWTPEPDKTDELARAQSKGADSAPVSKPDPDRELSAAELCLEGLEKGYLDGPLSVPAETGY